MQCLESNLSIILNKNKKDIIPGCIVQVIMPDHLFAQAVLLEQASKDKPYLYALVLRENYDSIPLFYEEEPDSLRKQISGEESALRRVVQKKTINGKE
jgi:hypothetical protein